MATVNNVFAPNVNILGSASYILFDRIWKFTRALKKAGWKYIASSDGSSKDTSADPAADYWNETPGTVGGITNAGASTVDFSSAPPPVGSWVVGSLTIVGSFT